MATVGIHAAEKAHKRTQAGGPVPAAVQPVAAEEPAPVVYRGDLYTLWIWLACFALLVLLHIIRQIEVLLP
jgi:hypothetical protein